MAGASIQDEYWKSVLQADMNGCTIFNDIAYLQLLSFGHEWSYM